jgi:hypothetical protein
MFLNSSRPVRNSISLVQPQATAATPVENSKSLNTLQAQRKAYTGNHFAGAHAIIDPRLF